MEELLRSLEIQKTYLSNINQQLLKPEYRNDGMYKLRDDVAIYVKALELETRLFLVDRLINVFNRVCQCDNR